MSSRDRNQHHKYVHLAVALDQLGTFLGDLIIPVDRAGYERLLEWAATHGKAIAFGIEGTGSYEAALTSHLRCHRHTVIEVGRHDRRDRRLRGESDLLDVPERRPGGPGRNRDRYAEDRRRGGRDAQGRSRWPRIRRPRLALRP